MEAYIYFSVAAGLILCWDFYEKNEENMKQILVLSLVIIFITAVIAWPFMFIKALGDKFFKPKKR